MYITKKCIFLPFPTKRLNLSQEDATTTESAMFTNSSSHDRILAATTLQSSPVKAMSQLTSPPWNSPPSFSGPPGLGQGRHYEGEGPPQPTKRSGRAIKMFRLVKFILILCLYLIILRLNHIMFHSLCLVWDFHASLSDYILYTVIIYNVLKVVYILPNFDLYLYLRSWQSLLCMTALHRHSLIWTVNCRLFALAALSPM